MMRSATMSMRPTAAFLTHRGAFQHASPLLQVSKARIALACGSSLLAQRPYRMQSVVAFSDLIRAKVLLAPSSSVISRMTCESVNSIGSRHWYLKSHKTSSDGWLDWTSSWPPRLRAVLNPFFHRDQIVGPLKVSKFSIKDERRPLELLPALDDATADPDLLLAEANQVVGGPPSGDSSSFPPPPRKSIPRKEKLEHGIPMLGGKPLTLRFDTTGNATYQAMTRHEALKMVQDAAATMVHVPELPATPQPSRTDKGIVSIPNVHMRDIRKLDNAFAIGNKPSITVRCQGILVNADPIRAVITRDACVVFLQDGANDLIPELEANFKDHLDECALHGFEFTALEAILATLCTALAKDAARVLPVAKAAVEKISQDATLAGELERLRSTKNTMDELNTRVTGMRKAFVDILENEEDLRMMHLTKLYRDPWLAHDLFSFDSEDLESLIEVYLQDIYDTQTQIALMLENLQNTRTIAMLKLDAKRNYLLMVNLTLTLWTTLITVPTFVVGTFGMNLNSYLQDVDYLFYAVVAGCVLFPIGVYRLVLRYFRERGINLSWKYK
ncbi:hypothetical protein H310_03659 [Aphanomyces invadans]|uniref:Magnesium transporter n=1 Tax=Aphanomyces invadans TaxID=157072 RepID=A0A024UIE4_9STRA|nr:hypothetical protein H310_03659 [Aphanomyces invadans]ETW06064.1 hypothetical protein H310_03659 [Aphanomyces invadans]|eukprot:XP_008865841.1 hypothetical protein H310_03659 [Aphanomyces invadans]